MASIIRNITDRSMSLKNGRKVVDIRCREECLQRIFLNLEKDIGEQ